MYKLESVVVVAPGRSQYGCRHPHKLSAQVWGMMSSPLWSSHAQPQVPLGRLSFSSILGGASTGRDQNPPLGFPISCLSLCTRLEL